MAAGPKARGQVGRRIGPIVLIVLAAAVVALVWTASRRGDPEPVPVTLAQLAFGQEDYDGRRVRTGGVVRAFGPEHGATRSHHVLEDEAANRVELQGGDPARYEGRAVVVVGDFRFAEGTGRVIDVERIEVRTGG